MSIQLHQGDALAILPTLPADAFDLVLAGPGGSVLDPFAGGAAVLKAASAMGLQAVGCEKVPSIYQRAAHDLAA